MKKYRILLCLMGTVILIGAAATAFIFHQNRENQTVLGLTSAQKLSDFDTLWALLEESYPFWRDVEDSGIDTQTVYDRCRANIAKTSTDIAFFKELQYFLKDLGGFGHLSVLDGAMYRTYLEALSSGDELLTEEEQAKLRPLKDVLSAPASRNTYQLLDQSHSGFRTVKGLKEEYKSQSAGPAQEAPSLSTSFYQNSGAAYIKIDSFALTALEKDRAALSDFFEAAAAYPHLIIDLRENSGGSDRYWQDLIVRPNAKESLSSVRYCLFDLTASNAAYLAANGIDPRPISQIPEPYRSQYTGLFSHYACDETAFEKADTPYSGRIWVLVDDTVYSAAENFVMFCKNTGFATLVGSPTGGDGGIADPMLVPLPNSGLILRFSALYGINADGSGNEDTGTQPDILLAEGEDALEYCLAPAD